MKDGHKKLCSFLEKFSTFFMSLVCGILWGTLLSSCFVLFISASKWEKVLPNALLTFITAAIFVISAGLSLFLACKLEKKLQVLPEGMEIQKIKRKSKEGTFLLLAVPLFLLLPAGVFFAMLLDSFYLLLPGFLLFLFIIAYSFLRPFETDIRRNTMRIAAFIFSGGFFLISSFVICAGGQDLSYTGNDISAIKKLSVRQKKICFPPNATKIRLSGTTMSFEYTCSLEEKDFLAYMKENPSQNFKKVEQDLFRKEKAPYYIYNNRRKNGGGYTFMYSVPEKKFYGSYSHH